MASIWREYMLGYLSATLSVVANSFPRAQLEENCELRGTDNSPQMETTVFIILQIFHATRAVLKIGEYNAIPAF